MTKMINRFSKLLKFSTLGLFTLVTLSACEIGLGEAVDLEPPVVNLLSHKDNDSVAQTFRLSGTASDNEGVTKLSIDFEEADLHYSVEPGHKWQKKTAGTDWIELSDSNALCSNKDGIWTWFVDVNTAEARSGMGSNYSLEILVTDEMGNSGKESKINCTLIVDEKIPNVSIYKPDIISSYTKAKDTFDSYDPDPVIGINGNTFLNLLNGEITLYGRQEGSASFKELLIELDDGITDERIISDNVPVIKDPTTEKIAAAYPLGNANKYYSRTLSRKGSEATDLRNWQLTIIPEEWITSSHQELTTGKHLVRIISTSISSSDAWERKVIGYFVWWPEADTPWIEANNGGLNDTSLAEIFPSSPISGLAYDDDGISSLTYTIKKKDDNSGEYSVFNELANKTIKLSEDKAKTSAWSINAPNDEGVYELSLKVSDLHGKSASIQRYFKIMDVKAPDIVLNYNASALANANGDINFSGTVSDDGRIESLKIIFLNPDDSTPANMIRYANGNELFWDSTDTPEDNYGNRIFTITLGNPTYDNIKKVNTYTVNKELNLFNSNELNIGLGTNQKHLQELNFLVRAKDSGATTKVIQISINGDAQSPELSITSIQQFKSNGTAKTGVLSEEIPNLAVVEAGDYVILKGEMADNSINAWNNRNRISAINFNWGNAVFEIPSYTKKSNGKYTWECRVTNIPTSSTAITASITDYGNNTTSVTKSVFIETTNVSLERIGAINTDGKYSTRTVIKLFLEFTKATNVTGNPTLSLNLGPDKNRKTATFVTSTNNTAQLEFDYTVQDGDNIEKLDVEAINGGVWKDNTVTGAEAFTPTMPTDSKKLLGTSRNITIDTTPPKVSSISMLSPKNSYKAGSTLLLRLDFEDNFSNNLTLTNANSIGLSFEGISNPSITAKKSGSSVLFTYTVKAGENANPLEFVENSLTHSGVSITDEAGNSITDSNWNLAKQSFSGIIIDNTPPAAPVITPAWSGDDVIVSSDTSFVITGEKEATVEYSIDNGVTWQSYTNTESVTTKTINIKNSGVYEIKAKQTDKAGNSGPVSAVKKVTVDKVEIFKNITVTNAEATYKTGDTITGQINFGKAVTLAVGSTVSLNVKRNGSALQAISIDNPTTKASSFTFTYTVGEKDTIDTTGNAEGLLKVIGWSFGTDNKVNVDYGTESAPNIKSVSVPYSTTIISGKNINESKKIKILSGYPTYQSYALSADNQTLTITFNRDISKISSTKEIRLEMTDTYKAPTVFTETQYSKLPATIKNATFTKDEVSKKYYTEGINGAYKATDTATTLTPDTTKKYILDFDIDDTDETLIGLFKAKDKDKVIVPLYSSNITASRNKLTVKLTGSYEIPVKGATYKLVIPSGIVQDNVQNQNHEGTTESPIREISGIVANGVEKPIIRIQKKDQKISSTGSAKDATVEMPSTAKMKITCQTSVAEITWVKKEEPSAVKTIKDAKTHGKSDLTTADVTIPPTTGLTAYNAEQTLGSTISNYAGATGLKIAIVAKATTYTDANKQTQKAQETSYEYAARTVLKFNLSTKRVYQYNNYQWNLNNNDYDRGGGYATGVTTSEGSKALYNLPVWVQGGDSPAGGNTIAGFPLAWDKPSTFKLMACDNSYQTYTYNDNNHSVTSTDKTAATGKTAFSEDGSWQEEHTYWYWVTWDLSSVCYTGLAVGDVPSDASTLYKDGPQGPKNWYVAECSWAAIKQNTALYPGETLVLSLEDVDNTDDNNNTKGAYLFRTKNYGHR
ncbi:hypothetical protein SAMN04487775_101364 [Treponema bryantii]|uniref:Ig-like domain (Group 3) n=1 Tax=Treponema bryantii TaxID=163 RepID=A0A1I3I6Z6_9SPIR|nr:hypothetical protein [Treponema bryantii]SFI43630.1 hypothetical protein SAMN04487775_101364 [Treponema bryantii]